MAKTAHSKQIAFENYQMEAQVQGSSDRSFGLVFTAVFIIFAGFKYRSDILTNGRIILTAALLLFIISMIAPRVLKPLNVVWTRFGLLLHKIVNPLILALLFYGIVAPMALLAKCFNWDPLRLAIKPSEKSYWIYRENQQSNLKQQF